MRSSLNPFLYKLILFSILVGFAAGASAVVSPRSIVRSKDVAGGVPPAPGVETLTAELSVGLGWSLCKDTGSLPPLESATSCEGLQPSLDDITVTLTPQPAGNPDWKLWSGHYTLDTAFKGAVGTVELLLSYAKVDGKAYAFVEGRVVTSPNGRAASYFAQVATTWDGLQATTVYGPASRMMFTGEKSLWMPYVQFAKKGYL